MELVRLEERKDAAKVYGQLIYDVLPLSPGLAYYIFVARQSVTNDGYSYLYDALYAYERNTNRMRL